ncbi:MAG: hypothetical protein HY815_03085 [Candidatus Riflebacteria bacterium]|nr:hypothetical protein [Candidatus Riflebacteria bacterium]
MFYQRGALTRRLVADEDIDAYDWDNQAIILTEAASGRVNLKAQSFIATLDGRRLYGGRGISRMSQMAVRYPVIYTDSVEGRTVLLVRPLHDLAGRPDLRDKAWELIASPEVMAHFKKLGKLRRPWSGGSFIRMQKSACRIRGLRVAQTESAIEAEYDIEGTRLGEYQVREEICWIGGKVRGSLGPVHETRVTPSSQRVHRKVAFPFHALARAYDGFAAGLTADWAKAPSWRVSVLLLPEWSKD